MELLGLDHVTVVRGRAEEVMGKLTPVHVVTARAVAPLDRLATWGIPLLRPYGEMLALKGDPAEEELKSAATALSKLGAVETSILHVGEGIVDPRSTVVRVEVAARRSGRCAGEDQQEKPPDRRRPAPPSPTPHQPPPGRRSVAVVRPRRLCIVFHVKRRSLLHGIISRGRAAAEPRDRKPSALSAPPGSLGDDASAEGEPLAEEASLRKRYGVVPQRWILPTEPLASLVRDPEGMGGSVHREPEVEESESLRSDANIAGPMTDPVPGPRTESMGADVSRETPPPMDDIPEWDPEWGRGHANDEPDRAGERGARAGRGRWVHREPAQEADCTEQPLVSLRAKEARNSLHGASARTAHAGQPGPPQRCRSCVFWELDPVSGEAAIKAGTSALEKESWISAVLLDWGSCGRVVFVDNVPVGFVLYAPPAYVPRSTASPRVLSRRTRCN
ncbi:Ribosomal RNA small subunit methyltransferase G [Streptomyces fumanus]